MPELPEVETVKRGLEGLIIGKTVSDVSFDWPKGFPNAKHDVEQFLNGAQIEAIKRRGKALIIELSTNYALVIHLKMTGQLVFVGNSSSVSSDEQDIGYAANSGPRRTNRTLKGAEEANNRELAVKQSEQITGSSDEIAGEERWGAGHPNDSLIGKLPDKSTRVTFTFSDDSKLYFNDQRKFGWVRLLPSIEVQNIDFFKKLGPEPLASNFTSTKFIQRLRKRNNSGIKAVLLDQTILAGVGNIYADESLWAAKIHPATAVKDVSDGKLKTLYKELQSVLQLAIEQGGSTDKNYVNAEGRKGSYMSFAKVFRREGQACERCGAIVEKSKVAGRGTHTCPSCQKL